MLSSSSLLVHLKLFAWLFPWPALLLRYPGPIVQRCTNTHLEIIHSLHLHLHCIATDIALLYMLFCSACGILNPRSPKPHTAIACAIISCNPSLPYCHLISSHPIPIPARWVVCGGFNRTSSASLCERTSPPSRPKPTAEQRPGVIR